MKKSLISLISMALMLCLILPLASCTEFLPEETESTIESESGENETGDAASPESNTDQSESVESTEFTESSSTVIEPLPEVTILPAPQTIPEGDGYTWKDAVVSLSANWNPHTYQTEDEAYPLSYLTSGFYSFFYNDEVVHKSESGLDPFEGYVIVPEMAAEMPVDITTLVKDEHPEFGIPSNAKEGYAYKIALNENATWQNGKKITADSYLYSMAQLLNPKLNNYRASEYFWIKNAEKYLRQGTSKYVDNGITNKYGIKNLVKGSDGNYYTKDGNAMFIAVHYSVDWFANATFKQYVDAYGKGYFDLADWEKLVAATDSKGLAPLNDDTYAWLLTTITGNKNWGETEQDAFNYFVERVDFESNYSFSNVGIYKTGEYEIVLVFEKPIIGFDLISKLTENWLVYEHYYEASKEKIEGGIYNGYCTSLRSTISYGPYKLTSYLKGRYMTFEKNESWYGYTDGKHIYVDPDDGKTYDMYQTTNITCWEADSYVMKNMFFKGELMSYSLGDNDVAEYRDSDNALFTPSGTVFFLILNGRLEAIKERETSSSFDPEKYDIETISLSSFHRAIALTLNKNAFAESVSPTRTGAYGLIGSAYVYDLETGEKYRDTDEAKQVLCEYYGVNVSDFESLDAAVASITGDNFSGAKELFTKAFEEALAAGYITDNDGDGISDQTISLEYASTATSEFMKRSLDFFNNELSKATEGTPFEGKVEIEESVPYGSSWHYPIREGWTDIILAGWSGDLLDPYALTENYTDPKKQYDAKWFDASAVSLTLNIDGEDITMTLREWSQALNGIDVVFTSGCEIFIYNFADADADVKLKILAAIEREIMMTCNYIPMLQDGSYILLSDQVDYASSEYNPVVGRGGLAYVRYNYNDSEWAEYIKISKAE